MNRTCPPCDYRCQGGKSCPARGGNYYAEYAEDNFQHLATPAATAQVKPYTAPEDDDGADFAKAIVKAAVIALIVACVLAALIYH